MPPRNNWYLRRHFYGQTHSPRLSSATLDAGNEVDREGYTPPAPHQSPINWVHFCYNSVHVCYVILSHRKRSMFSLFVVINVQNSSWWQCIADPDVCSRTTVCSPITPTMLCALRCQDVPTESAKARIWSTRWNPVHMYRRAVASNPVPTAADTFKLYPV